MGWLRDLMQDADPPVPSFGRLAGLCLRHPAWPPHTRPRARSLASLFSKLDREVGLEWLTDRPEIRDILARVLKCSPAAVSPGAGGSVTTSPKPASRFRFHQARTARPLELTREPLPPGFPLELATPQRWNRHVWRCATAAEAELVACWLRARRLATVHTLGDLAPPPATPDPLQQISTQPELIVACSEQPLNTVNLTNRNICVVVPGFVDLRSLGTDWTTIPSPQCTAFARELAHWLAARSTTSAHYSASIVGRALEHAAEAGLIDGFDAALGLAQVLPEFTHDGQLPDWSDLATRVVERRFSLSSVATRNELQWLVNQAVPALVGLVRNALEDGALSWDAPRTAERWQSLVPVEFQRTADVEWARAALGGTSVSASDLERQIASAPSGAYRVFSAFEAAGLLMGAPTLTLGPRWLALWARSRAQNDLLTAGVTEWGRALLNPTGAGALRARLLEDLPRRPSILDAITDVDLDAGIEVVLAAETIFELVGHSVLRGEQFATDRLHALWLFQAATSLSLSPELVTPRALCSHRDPSAYGSWLLASWAIAERLPHARGLPVVNPWTTPQEVPERAMDAVFTCIDEQDDHAGGVPGLRAAAVSMTCRIWRNGASTPRHPLTIIARLFAEPTWEDFRELSTQPRLVSVLQQLSRDRFESIATTAWKLWSAAGRDSSGHALHPRSSFAAAFWPHVTDVALRTMLSEAHPFISDIPYEYLSLAAHRLLLLVGHDYPATAVATLPTSLVSAAVETWGRTKRDSSLRALWNACSQSVERELRLLVDAEEWTLVGTLFDEAPLSSAPTLLALVQRDVEAEGVSTPLPLLARAWLQVAATTPHPARLQAYSLLTEIEGQLGGLRAASELE